MTDPATLRAAAAADRLRKILRFELADLKPDELHAALCYTLASHVAEHAPSPDQAVLILYDTLQRMVQQVLTFGTGKAHP